MRKTIAIVGYGYVGQAIENYFKEKFNVVIYDPAKDFTDKSKINEADLAIICVPTNMKEDGSVDLSAVEETFTWIETKLIVLKSTVLPGTTDKLIKKYNLNDALVFSPEFIGEGGYPVPFWDGLADPVDMKLHQYLIFGGSNTAREKIIPYFEAVSGPFAHYQQTDSTTAELTKYMCNIWIATKVTFCNEFFDIAEHYGVNWHELRELWLTDKRVGASHTLVYKENRGFGGKCIPKDTEGLIQALNKDGFSVKLIKSVLEVNKIIKEAQK